MMETKEVMMTMALKEESHVSTRRKCQCDDDTMLFKVKNFFFVTKMKTSM